MFYKPEDGHGLPRNPFNAIVTPRPIGWISTRNCVGEENLAPYSFFNAVAYVPPQVMFASTGSKLDRSLGKDSTENISETGVFCVNIVEFAMREKMNRTSMPCGAGINEFEIAEIDSEPCETIACLRVADAPASLECRMTRILKLAGESNRVVFGEVTGVHLRDDCIVDGTFEITRYRPVARLGYQDYSSISDTFSMIRPGG